MADECANEAMDGKGNNDYVRIAQYDASASVLAQMEQDDWGEGADDDDEWFATAGSQRRQTK